MTDKALVVLTGKSRDTLLKDGGTSHWVLTPAQVRGFKYAVCVRHANPPYDPGPGARPEPHGAAFLVGKISDVKFTYTENGRDRYIVLFDAFADVWIEDFWDGSRNPVRYVNVTDINARGIDFDSLDWQPMPADEGDKTGASDARLTIAAAKAGLAKTFGVAEDAIEIVIRA